MEYWKQNFKCPYYRDNGKQTIGCTVGKLNFPDKLSVKDVLLPYCANKWEECPISIALTKYEERLEQERLYDTRRKNRRT